MERKFVPHRSLDIHSLKSNDRWGINKKIRKASSVADLPDGVGSGSPCEAPSRRVRVYSPGNIMTLTLLAPLSISFIKVAMVAGVCFSTKLL